MRIPSGILADRTHPRVPMLVGIVVTLVGLLAFAPKTTIVWLVLAGMGTGLDASLFATGMLTEMLGTSTARNRGTAMSLSVASGAFGGFAGSSTSGLLIGPTGFSGVIIFGFTAEAIGIPIIMSQLLTKPVVAA